MPMSYRAITTRIVQRDIEKMCDMFLDRRRAACGNPVSDVEIIRLPIDDFSIPVPF